MTAARTPELTPQKTLARPVSVRGWGYWSGLEVEVQFHPAASGTGHVFVRTDLPAQPRIPVCVGNRIEVPLRTVLAQGTASVEMVEHILAALSAAGIDNCEIRVNRAEMPGMDGSSLAFTQALQEAGVERQQLTRPMLIVNSSVRLGDDASWLQAEPANAGEYHVEYQLDYSETPVIGRQTFGLTVNADSFERELASARTFLLEREAQWLRQQGLGRHVSLQDILVCDDQGPMENSLRFADECVRHKTLDLIGDLALAGCQLVGRFTAHRTGHRMNAEMVRKLIHHADLIEAVPVPVSAGEPEQATEREAIRKIA